MEKIEIITEDYQDSLRFIDKCDDHIFKIRNWALVIVSASIAYSFNAEKSDFLLINCIFVLCFLYFELVYKSLQNDAIDYSNKLAERINLYIQDPTDNQWISDYKFGFGYSLGHPSIERILTTLCSPRYRYVLVFYSLLIAAFLVGWVVGRA